MCLYSSIVRNPKYTKTKKNGGNIPAIRDKRALGVPIGCGRCKECMKRKANDWKIRLAEEIKDDKSGHFVTLTFSNEAYTELAKEFDSKGYELDNQIATLAVRRFLERWRKKFKKSVKHWLITELGHEGTENIHLHGIIWTDKDAKEIKDRWGYGYVWAGYDGKRTYISERTINYITKYVTKTDEKHRYYTPKILTSKGIGAGYITKGRATIHIYRGKKTEDYYKTSTGHKLALPVYYRNKLYTEEEREQLWMHKLDEETRFVDGIKIDISNNYDTFYNILNAARSKYLQLGYNGKYDWEKKEYEKQRRILLQDKRMNNNNNKKEEIEEIEETLTWEQKFRTKEF